MVKLGCWLPVGRIESLCGDRHVVATIPRDEDNILWGVLYG
jgi:hypothetical protein